MGDEDLCFSHPLHAGYRKLGPEIEADTQKEVCLDFELLQTAQGYQVCRHRCGMFLLLLGHVLAFHFCDYPGRTVWHVAEHVAVSDSHP